RRSPPGSRLGEGEVMGTVIAVRSWWARRGLSSLGGGGGGGRGRGLRGGGARPRGRGGGRAGGAGAAGDAPRGRPGGPCAGPPPPSGERSISQRLGRLQQRQVDLRVEGVLGQRPPVGFAGGLPLTAGEVDPPEVDLGGGVSRVGVERGAKDLLRVVQPPHR